MTQQASWYDDPDPYADQPADLVDDVDDEDYGRAPAWG